MQIEHYRIEISYSGLRKPVRRVCQSAESAQQMVQAYKRRNSDCKITVKRHRLIFEMINGLCLYGELMLQLPNDFSFLWCAHTVKAIAASKEHFKATVREVKEKVEAAKSDSTIIGITLWTIEDYYP